MSSPGEPEGDNSENYIDHLPVEILRMIFDRLDIQSVKNASLTCHRWNSIIFLSGYLSRFGQSKSSQRLRQRRLF
ncbi:F-box only protein 48-like [Anopheles albimanus]|uniref:F-box only protein 48-like n=1 Tax=Anopheles albimanus TaxID=7167 RepID=UPI0016416392|nr:F-box only protein 48-like [Anopheles albimanus]